MNIIDYFIKRLSEDDTPLTWKDIDGLELHELLKDSILKKIEPIDYPCTDGVLMCVLDTTGRIMILDIGNSAITEDKGEPFYIRGTIPYSFRFIKNKDQWCILF